MAITTDRVIVELEAKLDRYEANVARADAKFARAMDNIQKSASGTERMVSRAAGVMSAALAGVSAVALARTFIQITDEAKKMEAQLRLATQGFGSFGQAQEDVRRIADATRSGLAETASLYANFTRGAKELGASQAEAARATETFVTTLKISGASAAEASSATLQFGQALASGVLRGDEFNSVMEAAPRLARVLADSLGAPIGSLRKMAEEGQLTADVLLDALNDPQIAAQLKREIDSIPVTFGDAMTKVQNAALVTFSAFDRGGEFSKALANFVSDGADGFKDLEKAAEDLGVSLRGTFEGLGNAFDPLLDNGRAVFDALGLRAEDFTFNLRREIEDVLKIADKLLNIGPWIANLFGANGRYDSRLAENFRAGAAQSDRRQRARLGEAWLQRAASGMDVMGNTVAGTPGAPTTRRSPISSAGGASKATKAPASKLNPEAFAREEASLNDQILRLKAEETRNAEERASVELERIQSSKAAAMRDIAGDERYTAEQRARIAALTEAVSALEEARVIAERDTQIARNLLDIRVAGIRNEQDLLSAQADTASTRAERRDNELRLLDLAYEQERAELKAIIESERATHAQRNIADERLRMLDETVAARRKGINRQYESPMERYRREVGDVGAEISDSLEQVQVDGLQSLNDGLTDAIMGAKSLGDVFRNVANQIIADLVRIAIQQAIIAPLLGGGGGGGIIAGIGAALGFASGGSMQIGGRGGTDRNVLSLNGRPIANVSRGETLSISNRPLRSGGGGGSPTIIQVDARGAVMNDEFAAMILSRAQQFSAEAGQAAYQGAIRDTPALMAKRQRYGS